MEGVKDEWNSTTRKCTPEDKKSIFKESLTKNFPVTELCRRTDNNNRCFKKNILNICKEEKLSLVTIMASNMDGSMSIRKPLVYSGCSKNTYNTTNRIEQSHGNHITSVVTAVVPPLYSAVIKKDIQQITLQIPTREK